MQPTTTPQPPYCQWCGGSPGPARIVVQGPGVTICSDCIDLAAVIVAQAREQAADRG